MRWNLEAATIRRDLINGKITIVLLHSKAAVNSKHIKFKSHSQECYESISNEEYKPTLEGI